ncbi:MAG: sodium:proton exchanger [Frankiales bacterium]|nr:sodium:proton exchanger [Frankiales bacterium]
MSALQLKDYRLLAICFVLSAAAGILDANPIGDVIPFVVAGLALAALASLVGRCVDGLGDSLGSGATGVVQSALGNLPELFVCLFALNKGLDDVVRGAIVGSVLSNVLLVLGAAFLVGGLKHGTQTFNADRAKSGGLLLLIAVSALLLPALTFALHTPARGHEVAFSRVVAIVLLLLFAISLPAALKRTPGHHPETDFTGEEHVWPVWLAVTLLTVAGVGAALVSDWFVNALTPATESLGLSQSFAGLVVVSIAGNAVENVVGIQLAAKGRADYALSVILQSPLQIVLVLAPVLVLLSPLVGATFTLVLSPLLITVLIIAVLVTLFVVFDAESTWLEGAALIALYVISATAFFWG